MMINWKDVLMASYTYRMSSKCFCQTNRQREREREYVACTKFGPNSNNDVLYCEASRCLMQTMLIILNYLQNDVY